jgi:hypothetical protein
MVKTQVQIPEDLYAQAKRIAKEREISFAEVMRRGLEYMSRTHPPIPNKSVKLPLIRADHFAENFDTLDFKDLAVQDEIKPIH